MSSSSTAPTPSPAQSVGAGDVLALIRSGRASTRGALGRITGLSRTAVSARLASLERAGLVIEGAQESATGGRPASTLVFNADAGLVLAVALGRSRSQVAVCDLHGTVLAQVSHEQEVGAGPETVMPVVVDHLREMLADLGRSAAEVKGVGMSLAGVVDPAQVMSVESPALVGWDGVDLAPWVRQVTSAPVAIDTDCNVMALSQLRVEPTTLRERDDALVLKASTGIGVGMVADGRIWRGHRGAAGQLGHVKVAAGAGLPCRCGDVGCLETVAGGWALVERLRTGGHEVHHVRDLVAQAVQGDSGARSVVRESGRHIGEALAALVIVTNPRVVAVGGDMAGAFDMFAAGLREGLFGSTTALAGRDLQVVPAAHGEGAGLVGCAQLALDAVLSPAAVDAALRA
ncbi:ROK family transcriptional regulator [Nocardioides lacusdianchii]|uniref:ROK family transcriptional regulator n=1 Tax=Nocardioides lacusdianchii TaxID=2783664 RepID=UPI001CCBFDB7|nr:ROK family transcriptional regulator [Nocardioides lacusdianchii]